MDEDKVIIKQNWWHIEALLPPNPAHKIRQVMDIHVPISAQQKLGDISNAVSLKLTLPSKFSGLKIYARNARNNEIAFIEEAVKDTESNILKFKIIFKSEEFPIILDGGAYYYHLKIELNYLLLVENNNNEFSNSSISIDESNSKIATGYVNMDIDGALQPEFYLILPVGWKIGKMKNTNSENIENKNTTICYLSARNESNEVVNIELSNPILTPDDSGKKRYSYTANKCGSLMLKSLPSVKSMQITYLITMRRFFSCFCYILPILLLLLLICSIVIIFAETIIGNINYSNGITIFVSYSILAIAYYYTYITLRHQGYFFPEKTRKYYFTFMTTILVLIVLSITIYLILFIFIDIGINNLIDCIYKFLIG